MKTLIFLALLFSANSWAQEDYRVENVIYDAQQATANDPFRYSTVELTHYHGNTFCSGTLIAPDVVLTAGHCFNQKRDVLEVAILDDERIAIKAFKVHPGYKSVKLPLFIGKKSSNDIAVVLIERPSERGRPVGLAKSGDKLSSSEKLIVAGNGCREKQRDIWVGYLGYHEVSGAKYISGEGASSQINVSGAVGCQGDSGGSLFAIRNKKLNLFGVVSWGDTHGFYFRMEAVEPHLGWIKKTIAELRKKQSI